MADKFQLKALITGVDKLSPMLNGIRKKAGSFRKQLEKSGLGQIGFGEAIAGGALAVPFITGVKAAIAFESKMADVKKVVDFDKGLEGVQLAALNKEVLDLADVLPMAASGIAEIYAAGGQSGIARTELKAFATDAVKMGVAFDQTAAESGSMMATWRASFKLGQSGVVELADKINHLGNNGKATAKQISGVVTRIGALGGVAGLSTGQVSALGASMITMGVGEEVASTGIKNFIGALNKGGAATKAQATTFKALRLDSKLLAKGMQTDAQGTMVKVLKAIGKVDKDKQFATLTTIFGDESAAAIAPLLTNLDLLETNFRLVGDAVEYSGSMQKEYAARAATTENNLKLLTQRATRLGIAVGNALLPPFNDFMDVLGPVVTGVADLAAANPWLVKTVLGAAVGFGVLRLAVMGTVAAMKLFAVVSTMTPVGIAIRVIAVLAGVLIANWSKVGPVLGKVFSNLWEVVKFVGRGIKGVFDGLVGQIKRAWTPLVAWFKDMWAKIEPILKPIIEGAGKVVEVAGRFFSSDEKAPTKAQSEVASNARRTGWVASDRSLAGTQQSIVQGAAQADKMNMNGEMVVRFENAPPGMQVQSSKTDQPNVEMTAFVGYRSISRRGARE